MDDAGGAREPGPGAVPAGTADPADPADVLRERWSACSSALGWPASVRWEHPTVDRVCRAVRAHRDGRDGPARLERALTRWSGARAGEGVGLAETLSDLAALHTALSGLAEGAGRGAAAGDPVADAAGEAAPRGLDGARLLRAVAVAWADVACGDLAETAAIDPLSGLASLPYLRTRLAEVYRGARARGHRAGAEHALVVVTLEVHGWSRVAPLSLAGEAAAVVFDAGESLAVVGRATVVVLAPREGLAERTRVLRRLLARRLTPAVGASRPPGVRIVALPATHGGACALLERLRGGAGPA